MAATRERLAAALGRLWPEERIAAAYLAAIVALFAARGLPFAVGSLLGYYAIFLGAITALTLPGWAVVQLLRARHGEPWRGPAALDLGRLARALLVLLAVLIGYTNLKSRIFALHPTLYDRELARLDAWLHFGGGDFQSWVLSTTWSSLRMGLLDVVYFYAWVPLALPFAVVFARGGGAAARRFLGALALIYVAGGFLYLAVPSVGPAFFERERFAHLAQYPGYAVQEAMLEDLRRVSADPRSPATAFFGIAAFPSLHLASTALGIFAAWRWSRRLVWLLVPWNIAVAWSAVAWGWHYAVDFYPGVLLAWGAWRAAGALGGDAGPGPPPAGPGAAPAAG